MEKSQIIDKRRGTFIPDSKVRSRVGGNTPPPPTQGLIEILGFMVIFDENQGVSDLSKYEFLCPIYVKIIKFLVIGHHFDCS